MIAMAVLENMIRRIPDFKGKRRLFRYLYRNKIQNANDIEIQVRDNVKMLLPNIKETLAFDLFINGVYEEFTLQYLQRRLPQNGIFLDLGANIGAITIPLVKIRTDILAVCVEASPDIFRYLQHNLKVNALDENVRVYNKALWSQSNLRLPFYSWMEKFGTGSLSPVFTDKSIVVETVTIDDILLQLGIERIDFIKIDIEGYEYFAFQGASQLLNDVSAPDILFEFADWAQRSAGVDPAAEQKYLRACGYGIFKWDYRQMKWKATQDVMEGFEMLLASKRL